MDNEKKSVFETKIKPLLEYIGAIGAILMSIAYIVVIFVLINGFEFHKFFNTTIFAIVNAGVGFIIMQFLKIQGQSFAEHLPENEELLKQYYNTKTKDKKPHSMTYYWVTTVAREIFTRGCTLAATTIGLIYIVIEGSNDWNMLALAIVNLIMFICFGLLSLSKTYDYFNNSYIPYIKDQLKNNIESSHVDEVGDQKC